MADNKPLIVILGINSRQGSSIARHFIRHPHMQIRGITRNILSERSQSWAAQGVAMVQVADHRDEGAMEAAFRGATGIFAVTDFYRHITEHSTLSLAGVWKKTPEEIAGQRELAEGKVMIAAVAATVKSLRLFVLSSLCPAYGEAEDTRGLQQFHSKAKIVQYMETNYPELTARSSLLKPALYMEEWTIFLRCNPENGHYTFGSTVPASCALPWTNITDDMGTLFNLCMVTPRRLNIAAISDIVSGAEICTLFTEITGIPCTYVQYSEEELANMLGNRGQIIVDMLAHIFRKRYYEEPGIQLSHHLLKDRPEVADFKPTTFAEFMKADLTRSVKKKQGSGGEEVGSSSGGEEMSDGVSH
ncbi:NAD(P)-binding protein [Cucurbitaria berberidis CBS 394.84]|uniref:NAD(P)-binding protein n=1 Tax=Cucurbitaria berberidis CBS 394.84 TaxID=1168544 RepID=A0A9P4L9A2_9PLEO|nr:NAD(P)-binding protein [Cucurbitaria berberidis CBS 394.84]KAF1846172.1 NAD(P)-binding protein [Cucurbitaria berberidis CBS 394.84]